MSTTTSPRRTPRSRRKAATLAAPATTSLQVRWAAALGAPAPRRGAEADPLRLRLGVREHGAQDAAHGLGAPRRGAAARDTTALDIHGLAYAFIAHTPEEVTLRVLVTGASGFIGRHVVRALVGRGHEVRALVRGAAAGGPRPWAGDVETVTADLSTASDLDGALGGVECVVHLAAVVHGTAAEQHAATVGGTARLLAAMARTSAPARPGEQLRRLRLGRDRRSRGRVVAAARRAGGRRLRPLRGGEVGAGAPRAPGERGEGLGPHRAAPRVGGGASVRPDCVGLALGPVLLVIGPGARPALSYVRLRRPLRDRRGRPARPRTDVQRRRRPPREQLAPRAGVPAARGGPGGPRARPVRRRVGGRAPRRGRPAPAPAASPRRSRTLPLPVALPRRRRRAAGRARRPRVDAAVRVRGGPAPSVHEAVVIFLVNARNVGSARSPLAKAAPGPIPTTRLRMRRRRFVSARARCALGLVSPSSDPR